MRKIEGAIKQIPNDSRDEEKFKKVFSCAPKDFSFKPGTEFSVRGVIDQLPKYAKSLHISLEKGFTREPNSALSPSMPSTSRFSHFPASSQISFPSQVPSTTVSRPTSGKKRTRIPWKLKTRVNHKYELLQRIIVMLKIADPGMENPEIEIMETSRTATKICFDISCVFCRIKKTAYVCGYKEKYVVNTQYNFSNLTRHVNKSHKDLGKNLTNHAVIIFIFFC
jgi:hypothetical protein